VLWLVNGLLVLVLSAICLAATPRQHIRFDDGWKFFREPMKSAQGFDQFQWSWQPSTAKSLDDIPSPTADWRPYRTGQNVLHHTPEFALFRATLDGNSLAGRVLHFESVDDNAQVYLNGKAVGRKIGYSVPFDVDVSSAWQTGHPNELLVLVENTGGEGGINGRVKFELPAPPESVPAEAAPAFQDGAWRTVHLPHDYVVEGTFNADEETGHGSLPRPLAWYRKTFSAPDSWRGNSVWVQFDGVYRNSDIYFNGVKLGHQNSGYIGFRYDLSKLLRFGQDNVLAVHVDPTKDEGWWYEGGGIYRHVWINVAAPVHISPDGIFVRSTVTGDTAKVEISTEVTNPSPESTHVTVRNWWIDPSGLPSNLLSSAVGPTGIVDQQGTIGSPVLWTLDAPKLYGLRTQVLADGKVVDEQITHFGVRTIRFDKDQGFFLNGVPVKLQGTCNHQDHAGVGTAMSDSLLVWRLTELKKMGSNAYRCSHNPPAPELLDACDRMGILVMDETRHLGNTTAPKSPHGTKADDLSEVAAMVRRDRNHPSIIIWSLYNEEPLQGTVEGGDIFVKTRTLVDSLDGTRPCAGATNYGYDKGIVDVTNLYGINYNTWVYDPLHKRKPDLPLFGSETASTVSTRGEYVNDPAKGYVSAYDLNFPGWAATAENAWQPLAARPWMAGGFVWTGFDYKGEPTPYGWPCINSHFGIIDIAGFPKDNFYYYQSVWGTTPMVHVLPSWNGPVKAGEPVDVWAYSNGESVELLLNGTSLGRQTMPPLGHVHWSVPFAPGTLEARAYRRGVLIATDKVETTGPAVAIKLKTDRSKILGDGEDLTVVTVQLVDSKGRVVPDASEDIHFTIDGAAAIGGVGNGDPSDHDPDKADHRKAFHGLCMVLAQSNGKAGEIVVRAHGKGLAAGQLTLSAQSSHTQ
jgi:beta-galactosidase